MGSRTEKKWRKVGSGSQSKRSRSATLKKLSVRTVFSIAKFITYRKYPLSYKENRDEESNLGYFAVEGAGVDGVDDDVLLSVLIKVPLEYPGVRVHSNLQSNELPVGEFCSWSVCYSQHLNIHQLFVPYGLWMEAIKNSFNTSQQNRPDTGWYQFCRISGYTEKRTNCLLLFWASCSFPALPHIWPDIRQVSDIRYRYPAIWKVYPAKYRKHIPVHQRTIRPYKKWNFSKQSCNKEHSFWCIISWQLNIQKGIKSYLLFIIQSEYSVRWIFLRRNVYI